jgi:hypothetical protein
MTDWATQVDAESASAAQKVRNFPGLEITSSPWDGGGDSVWEQSFPGVVAFSGKAKGESREM